MASISNEKGQKSVPDEELAYYRCDFEFDEDADAPSTNNWSKGSPYDTSVVCTYMFPDDIFTQDESDKLTDEDKTHVMDIIYRAQFLKIFCLEIFDGDMVARNMGDVGSALCDHPKLKMMLTEFGAKMCSISPECTIDQTPDDLVRFGFAYAMSWHMMYHTHQCIIDYFTTGCVRDTLIERTRSAFEQDPCWQSKT